MAIAHDSMLSTTGTPNAAEKEVIEALRESQDELRQLQKMESIGQLTGSIAHDFNNYLQNIVASLELIRKLIASGRGAESERFIAIAIGSAQSAAALNQRLLSFSRRQPLDPKPLNANELLRGMEDILQRSIPHSLKLEFTLTPELRETCCDSQQFENTLLNLVLNARDAMPDHGTVTIRTSNVDVDIPDTQTQMRIQPGQYVCVEVTDSGTGMSQDIAQHACDPFFTTKAKGLGNGLGLTMARRFVRQHDGDIKIETQTGRGTSVKLYLPRYPNATSKGSAHGSLNTI